MDWMIIKKWATRKGVVGVFTIAVVAGLVAPVTATGAICAAVVGCVTVAGLALVDWQREKNPKP